MTNVSSYMRFTGFSFSKNSSIITENMWKRVNKTNSTPHIIYKDKLHICMIPPVFEEKRALKHFLFRKQFFMILFLFGKCMKRHWHFSPFLCLFRLDAELNCILCNLLKINLIVYLSLQRSVCLSSRLFWRLLWRCKVL